MPISGITSKAQESCCTGQLLILIGSDGERAVVSRAIATEASYVLRDLLDGQDLAISRQEAVEKQFAPAKLPLNDLDSLFEDYQAQTAIPDLMDIGTVTRGTAAGGAPGAALQCAEVSAPVKNHHRPPPLLTVAAGGAPAMHTGESPLHCQSSTELGDDAIELPFPYFTGNILRRVCYHMSYRYRTSNFGVEDGFVRVYANKMREIPKPMTLPLTEYLDSRDRGFLADWDELTTVLMIKAATLLNYEELLQLASAKMASYLCEKSVEGVRTLLGVESDFTALEEAELMKEQVIELNRR